MPEKSIAVSLLLPSLTRATAEEHLEELAKLVESAGGEVVERVFAKRPSPDPATYIGSGKAEEVKSLAGKHGVKLIVFDDDLSPAQTRNLEKIVEGAKVIDRSGLILDIFARRARTREARTQVELAQLEYMLPRLTRAWSHLERQAGGIGTRGVGETQLELDRRIVRTRIAKLKEDLVKIEQTRELQRKQRQSAYTVALVGYTNAGKSTLFNRLTHGGAEAANKLFATLDARSHKAAFEMPRETVIVDTVGFIRKLPHNLVASFRSTMEEAVAADLVLHVIDASHPQFSEQRAIGDEVLADLGVDPKHVLEVYNKADKIEDELAVPRRGILVSALEGTGIEALVEAIRERQREGGELLRLEIPHAEARLAAKLHEVAEIHEQRGTDDGTLFVAWIPHDSVHLFKPFAVAEQVAAKAG
jgi:GTP-binding protein HflX